MKTKLLVILLAILFALSASAGAGQIDDVTLAPEPVLPTLEKGPYLIYNGVNTEMMVLWQLEATRTCTLEWGLDTSYGSSVETTEFGTDYQHEHVITGLATGTKYYYQVTVGDDTYPGSFTAAPDDGATSIKILAFGDTRSQPKKMDDVTGQMIATYDADEAFQTIALHSGDWVNSNAELDWAEEFFNRDCANNREFQANVPIAGCRGNHEGGASLLEKYYPYPYTGTDTIFYGSFDYGPIHVVIIDDNIDYTAPDSVQHNWLKADLANTNKLWKIAVYHSPAWGTGWHSNDTTAQNHLHPLFVEYNVSVVINGDNHNYVRCEVEGIRHITSGGGGAPLYSVKESEPYVVTCTRTYHHCEIDIVDDVLNFTAVDSAGKVIDTFTLVADFDPPTSAPTFATAPYETGPSSIAMEATTVTDEASSVEYNFTCTDGGGNDSGWQAETSYEDTDLTPDTTYTYTVTARDTSVNHNITATSDPASATTTMDIVEITKAEYSTKKSELKVEATSDAGGNFILTVVDYGNMTYKASKDTHSYSGKPVARPENDTIKVISTGGGEDTITVTVK